MQRRHIGVWRYSALALEGRELPWLFMIKGMLFKNIPCIFCT